MFPVLLSLSLLTNSVTSSVLRLTENFISDDVITTDIVQTDNDISEKDIVCDFEMSADEVTMLVVVRGLIVSKKDVEGLIAVAVGLKVAGRFVLFTRGGVKSMDVVGLKLSVEDVMELTVVGRFVLWTKDVVNLRFVNGLEVSEENVVAAKVDGTVSLETSVDTLLGELKVVSKLVVLKKVVPKFKVVEASVETTREVIDFILIERLIVSAVVDKVVDAMLEITDVSDFGRIMLVFISDVVKFQAIDVFAVAVMAVMLGFVLNVAIPVLNAVVM